MKHKPALYALARLHAELGGKMKENAKEAARLRDDMRHVEHVLKLLEPGYNTSRIAPRRKQKPRVFKAGVLFRRTLDLLKEAARPMTAREVADILVQRDPQLARVGVTDLASNVNQLLKRHPAVIVGDGQRPQRWRIMAI